MNIGHLIDWCANQSEGVRSLLGCAAYCVGAVVVGAVTRLIVDDYSDRKERVLLAMLIWPLFAVGAVIYVFVNVLYGIAVLPAFTWDQVKLPPRCPKCGRRNRNNYCNYCGTNLKP